ncbi:MAG TPA: hypothetical protein VMW10_05635, partial [Alphaproteobacteria bacterium]|nr:hypothetical protein [Alphaproteobacteria bacterium]
ISSATAADATVLNYDGKEVDCKLQLSMSGTGNGAFLHVKYSGQACGDFCTSDVAHVFMDKYPLRTHTPYPVDYNVFLKQCYATSSPTVISWCTSADVQSLDKKLKELADRIDTLKNQNSTDQLINDWRTQTMQFCESSKQEQRECFKEKYIKKINALENLEKKVIEENKRSQEPGNPDEASSMIDQIEGVYKHRFKNGLVDGTSYESENIFEIVRVAKDAIYFKLNLQFYNGHTCTLHGIAQYIKDKAFLFRGDSEDICSLKIEPTVDGVMLKDGVYGGNPCRDYHCGARGGFNDLVFKKSLRRPIKYMKTLKNSADYKKSTEEFGSKK